MDLRFIILGNFLLFSLALNVFLFIRNRRLKKSPPPAFTKDAQELLSEIASGSAILKISVLDPEALFLRSPR